MHSERQSSPFIIPGQQLSPFRDKEPNFDFGESSRCVTIDKNTDANFSAQVENALDVLTGSGAGIIIPSVIKQTTVGEKGRRNSVLSRQSKKFKSISPVNVDSVDGIGMKGAAASGGATADLGYVIIGEKKALQKKKQPTPLAQRSRNLQKIR